MTADTPLSALLPALRRAYEDAAEAVCVFSMEQRLLFANAAQQRLSGAPREEARTLAAALRVHPDDADKARRALDAAFSGRGDFGLELRLVRRDGAVRWTLFACAPLFDEQGRQLGVTTQALDVTERKNADAAWRSAAQSLREQFDLLPAMCFAASEMGVILSVNRWGARALGYEPDELQGRLVSDVFHPADREALRRQLAACLQDPERPGRWELRKIRKDGSELRVRETARAAHGPGGEAIFLIVCEEAVPSGDGAAGSTAEAARAKADLLAQLGHELRTPVNIITSMTDLLLEGSLDPERRRLVEAVRRSSALLESVAENILYYSKSEAGMMTRQEEDFSLRRAVAETAGVFRERAAARGVALNVEIADGVPDALRGDAGHLRRVLANLIANAVKFTEQGAVTVRAGCAGQTEEQAMLVFAVEDTGIGIPHEAQRLLFTPFVQHHDPAGRRYPGTGLGLAIAKGLVELLGGSIEVHSVPARGTVFTVRLPFKKRRD